MRLVLDTNVWLDWLVFGDPSIEPLKNEEIFISEACAAELERVLAYDLGKHSVPAGKREACLAECRRIAQPIGEGAPGLPLPRCPDPKDQIFLEAALAARADFLVTKDRELLEMARLPLPFRIVLPGHIHPHSRTPG